MQNDVFWAQAYFSGKVQGVGFRYRAAEIAQPYRVAGYVYNCPDGRVELWAEGPEAEVRSFITAIRQAWPRFIDSVAVTEGRGQARYADFSIKY